MRTAGAARCPNGLPKPLFGGTYLGAKLVQSAEAV